MTLDIRLPVGILFAIVGALLAGYGLASDSSVYQHSMGININLYWGLILLAFGIVMILLGRHVTNTNRRAGNNSEQPAPKPGH